MLRNIKKICKNFTEAEIYYHIDLDGVASAIIMREILKEYNVETKAFHSIQYGDREWSIPKPKSNRLLVLVDFAHGKSMFHIHTDHHDKQVGVKTNCVLFKKGRSNAQTLSDVYRNYFPNLDLEIINTVDSADFVKHNLKPKQLRNFIIKDKLVEDSEQNRWLLGLACNKLILTYKNRPHFLDTVVMYSKPSLLSIYLHANFLRQKMGFPSLEQTQLHSKLYKNRMKEYSYLEYDAIYKIVRQFGGGFMFDPGSYDRYIVFENHPRSQFLIIIWPMGLLQVSFNPFRKKQLENVNLGDISKEILEKHKSKLEQIYINIYDIKYENEKRILKERRKALKDDRLDVERVGFHTNDLLTLYENNIVISKNDELIKFNKQIHHKFIEKLRNILDKRIYEITNYEVDKLKHIFISAYDLIVQNSGGHASITNLSGFNYLAWNKQELHNQFGTDSFEQVMKVLSLDFYGILKDKILQSTKKKKTETDLNWSLYNV